MKFSSFDQVISYMERFMNLERKTDLYSSRTYRLDRMADMLNKLDNPQNSYKTIHIAGSKGKGSTASFIAKALEKQGYKTGLYMSPHVSDYRERFTLSGTFVDDKILCETGDYLKEKLDSYSFGDTFPTTFEMYTAFAFLLFKKLGCSYAVIETGLGGRLDATNVIKPIASIITPIELEHTELLGNTITEIATEKSKIIKKDIPSFISYQKEEAEIVLREEAKNQNSEFYSLKDCVKELKTSIQDNRQNVELVFDDSYKVKLKLKMLGAVQAYNCALAILVLRKLGLFDQSAISALEENVIPGRMEEVSFERKLYLDGAHTEQSMKNLLETFKELYPETKGICIFASVKGKHYYQMLQSVLSVFDQVVITKPGTFKVSNPTLLYECAKSLASSNQTVVLLEDTKQALQYCINHTQKENPILACGSFYLAGVIKEALNGYKN